MRSTKETRANVYLRSPATDFWSFEACIVARRETKHRDVRRYSQRLNLEEINNSQLAALVEEGVARVSSDNERPKFFVISISTSFSPFHFFARDLEDTYQL
jgi:hypothetical protein